MMKKVMLMVMAIMAAFAERLAYEGYTYDEMCQAAGGGSKGAAPAAPPPQVAPTAPVEEASVDIEDEDALKKAKTSKGKLKVPLTAPVAKDTGLKV